MMSTFITMALVFVVGLALGIFSARFIVKKELEKNPPISEDMIVAMLKGTGQPATKKRVNAIMKDIKQSARK